MKKHISLLKLFYHTFLISAFTFGGGYVIVPLLKDKFSQELGLISDDEIMDLIAIGQSIPGPIAVNSSILIGFKLRGILGGLFAAFGTVLPPLIIISIISYFYDAFRSNPIIDKAMLGMRAGICAIIVKVVFGLVRDIVKLRNYFYISIMIFAFIAVALLHLNIVYVLLFCIALNFVFTLYIGKKEESI